MVTRILKQSIFSESEMVQILKNTIKTLCHLVFNMYVAAGMVTDGHTHSEYCNYYFQE